MARNRPRNLQWQPFTTYNNEKRHYSCSYFFPLWTSTSSKMVTFSVVICDRWTILCLYSCRWAGLRRLRMIYHHANYKSDAELLHRSSKLEMALNSKASRTETMIMFDMNGLVLFTAICILSILQFRTVTTCRHQRHYDRSDDCRFLTRLVFSCLLNFIVLRLDPPSFASRIDKVSRKDGLFLRSTWID